VELRHEVPEQVQSFRKRAKLRSHQQLMHESEKIGSLRIDLYNGSDNDKRRVRARHSITHLRVQLWQIPYELDSQVLEFVTARFVIKLPRCMDYTKISASSRQRRKVKARC
jgi:hypothetical protein